MVSTQRFEKEYTVKLFFTLAITGILSAGAYAKDLFLLTKSVREKNVIHYDAKIENCQLKDNSITAFWILGEKQGQRQELTREEIPKFQPKIIHNNGQELEFTIGSFNEVQNEIADHPIAVKLVNCEPKAYLRYNGEDIELNEIYAKISIIKMGVKYLLIKGKKINGSKFSYKVDV